MSDLGPFHPAIRRWFSDRLGEPTPPQREGWPAIRAGRHTLIAAPTGSGKTLAAFLSAIESLIRQGPELPDETEILYVSPLKALSNDVQKNLQGPLAEIRALDPSVPEVRVLVRTGDTPPADRTAMARRPPHVLVTTPESFYLLLTSESGRRMLSTVRTVIVDEIHALVRDKRGSHLALSLERLEELAGSPLQRVGLSATQKPLEEVGRFLVGEGRRCTLVDAGTFRELDLGIEVPPSPLGTVCSHEQWAEIHARIGELVSAHRTTLVFVNTRKMAERIAGQLTKLLGEAAVTSHHGSLSRDRRLDAEERLKSGRLRALVATASLELGIDIGDVDLAIQVGATRSIATFLQRVGRAGHALRKVPKGRLFPLTLDELVEGAALVRCIRRAILDRTPIPSRPLDILAQQVVAACVAGPWEERELFEVFRRAWPYRDLSREEFDDVVALHCSGRGALLHRDGVNGRVMATRRARLAALLSGGAIPDTADYQVRLEPEGTLVGTVNEDWAIESNRGDIFQLGNASWRILRVEPGTVRVADAKGLPPSLPFWLGEAPGRTRELAAEIGALREECPDGEREALDDLRATCGDALPAGAAVQIADYVAAGRRALGAVPTQKRVILERFFDESGGMQLVVHAPFGSKINRAWGLALRKKFCVGFGFELQAASNEEAIVLSLGPQHSFALEQVFEYLHPNTARDVLVQALLPAPMFETRWRWNAQRSLLLERSRNGKRVPANLLRMRANDLLAAAFPQVLACPETLPGGPLEVPMEHPIVRQTVEDCLTEATDVDGFLEVLRGLRDGSIERRAVDTVEPSAFARGILSSQPYSFLDDAPLEERRTQAVSSRRLLDARSSDGLGSLDPDAIARVRAEAWPRPESAEEVHEALLWMGYVTVEEARPWQPWLDELAAARRVVEEGDRWFAAEASRDPKTILRGRMEALGPVVDDDPLFVELESEGAVLRTRIEGRAAWCDRRLLARIHRYTLDRLRREIEPVSAAQFLRFLACWQHVDPAYRLDGPRGVAEVVAQLAGFEVPAAAWEANIFPARVRGYRREWLDAVTFSGEVTWGRLWGTGSGPIRRTPICLVPREDLESWAALGSGESAAREPGRTAREVQDALTKSGAVFLQELVRATGFSKSLVEEGLAELIGLGRVTCDSFAGLRWLIVPAGRRRVGALPGGRWTVLGGPTASPPSAEFVARRLLHRTGVVFRRTLAREKQPLPWRDVARACRLLEARGEVRGGRFVAGFDGEQYALPEAVTMLRDVRRRDASAPNPPPLVVSAADPLNFRGILTPDERVPPTVRRQVRVA
ncbi:MAG TPA: DEAD/DEAH box helicase [Thermoanaerobaculia bacterium]|nr:DEAD/DEAH box helicase [Thermoanaerobaculia bacterium]